MYRQYFILLYFHTNAVQDMADLEKRIAALEVGATFDATQDDVKKVEQEFLTKLQEIRETMVKNEADATATTGGMASSKELQALVQENDALKKRNAKLEYRVQHMLKSMEGLYNSAKHKDKQ
jgi:predicted  nucleic acid-binding Zn-ribbon protein